MALATWLDSNRMVTQTQLTKGVVWGVSLSREGEAAGSRGVAVLEEPEFTCAYQRLGAVPDLELAEDAIDMLLDGAEHNDQDCGDLSVRVTGRDQAQHLQLAVAQWLYQILDFGFWTCGWEWLL